MRILEYLDWIVASRTPGMREPLTLPPVQRSALWGPIQIVNFWRSIFQGMPIGSFYLSQPGVARRALLVGGKSATDDNFPEGGFDLLDGQQRTNAMLLAVDGPTATGKCLWVEVCPDEIRLHLTTRAQPFGFTSDGRKLGAEARRTAREQFDATYPAYEGQRDFEIFDQHVAQTGAPPRPHSVKQSNQLRTLADFLRAVGIRHDITPDVGLSGVDLAIDAREVADAVLNLREAEIALILAHPPGGRRRSEWLLDLFDRIGSGGTPLSGPERLFSMYKHHVPRVHDAVEAVSAAGGRLLDPVEVARTAIRIAGTRKQPALFGDPDPISFREQIADGGPLRPHLDELIEATPSGTTRRLADAFSTVNHLLRYRPQQSEGRDPGFPAVLIGDLNPELIRVLVHWADQARAHNVDGARGDLIRFALFWHLCVTNDGKAAYKSAQVLSAWKADGSFPWSELVSVLIGVEAVIDEDGSLNDPVSASDPSAHRLVAPGVMRSRLCLPPSSTLKSWAARFEQSGPPNLNELLIRWWWRSGILLWIQRDYIDICAPAGPAASAHEEDRPLDLDHIQPQAAYGRDWRVQRQKLPEENVLQAAFREERGTLGGGIGNLRWVPYSVNRGDGDASIDRKLRFDDADWTERKGEYPGARDGGMDPKSQELWQRASGDPDATWTEDRIVAWQQAVEERTVWLYETMWEEAGFDGWRSIVVPSVDV